MIRLPRGDVYAQRSLINGCEQVSIRAAVGQFWGDVGRVLRPCKSQRYMSSKCWTSAASRFPINARHISFRTHPFECPETVSTHRTRARAWQMLWHGWDMCWASFGGRGHWLECPGAQGDLREFSFEAAPNVLHIHEFSRTTPSDTRSHANFHSELQFPSGKDRHEFSHNIT